MKKLKISILLFLFLLSISVKGQDVEYFKIYSTVSFMPAGGGQKETYQKIKKNITHFSEKRSYQKQKKTQSKALAIGSGFEREIHEFDSLIRLYSFQLPVDASLILELKRDTLFKEYYRVNDVDIERFFENRKLITLSLEEIKPDTLDQYTVYDGRPFSLYFSYKFHFQDTVEFKYTGNLDDGIKTKDIRYWLPIYFVVKKYRLFSTNSYINNFFDNRHLRSVLFRFIKWRSS